MQTRLLPYFPDGFFEITKKEHGKVDDEKERRMESKKYWQNVNRGLKSRITVLENQLIKKGK